MSVKFQKSLFFNLLSLLLLFFSFRLEAQSITEKVLARQQQIECLDLIYKTRFDSAKRLIANFPKQEEAYKSLFQLFSLRWEYIPIATSKEKDNYLNKLLSFSEAISSRKDVTQQLYFHTTTELLLAEYYYNNGETFKALLHGKRAYPFMVQALDATGSDPELLFVKGMYLYYMDFFRSKGFVYRTALFPLRDGDQTKGLAFLEKSAAESSLAFTEANIYLAHIYLHIENKPLKALPYSQKLVKMYPENAKFNELLIDNLISCGRYDEASLYLDDQLKQTYAYFKIPALYFAAQVEVMQKKNFGKAKELLKECILLSSKTKLCQDVAQKAEVYLSDIK